MKAIQLFWVESAEGLDERERGSAALEAPRPPNSLLSISAAVRPLGPRFPPTLEVGGETTAGKKEHNQTDAEKCRSMYVCVLYVRTPVDSYDCACVYLHMYLCTVYEFM